LIFLYHALVISAGGALAAWTFEPVSTAPPAAIDQSCAAEKWRHKEIRESGRPIASSVCGDLRGDGVERMYAALKGGPVVEMELQSDGPRTVMVLVAEPIWPVAVAAARAKGRKNPSLFVSAQRWISELNWNGKRWDIDSIPQNASGMTTGFVAAALRGDGYKRLYISSQKNVTEYRRTPAGWSRELMHPRLGYIDRLAVVPSDSGRDELFIDADLGVHSARWNDDGSVAVLPFLARELPAAEGAAVADLLRVRLVQLGHCTVVEREQIESVLKEQAFQGSGLTDAKTAVKVGKLLGAERMVIGSVGTIDTRKFFTVSVVSVDTGVVEKAEYARWRSGSGELDQGIELLAQSACPSTAGSR